MKKCSYCGKESEDTAESCAGCGQTIFLKEPILVNADISGELNAKSATKIFLIVYAVNIFGMGIFFALQHLIAKKYGISNMGYVLATLGASTLVTLMAGFVMIQLVRRRIPNSIRNCDDDGLAWVLGPATMLVKAVAVGFLIGKIVFILRVWANSHLALQHRPPRYPGINSLPLLPVFPMVIWAVTFALLLPIMEEMLFRGILFGGFKKTWGVTGAAVLTTLISLVLYIPFSWPSLVGILGVVLTALWFRLKARAIGPAIGVHVGFNCLILLENFL